MRRFGPRSTDLLTDNSFGAVTIAELLVVLAVSSIVLLAVLNEQEFVTRLSQRFFDCSELESESRLLLLEIQSDLSRSERILDLHCDRWLLIGWRGDTIEYDRVDSSIVRNDTKLIDHKIQLLQFHMCEESVNSSSSTAWSSEFDRAEVQPGLHSVLIHISIAMSYKAKILEFDTLYPLRRRSPGTQLGAVS